MGRRSLRKNKPVPNSKKPPPPVQEEFEQQQGTPSSSSADEDDSPPKGKAAAKPAPNEEAVAAKPPPTTNGSDSNSDSGPPPPRRRRPFRSADPSSAKPTASSKGKKPSEKPEPLSAAASDLVAADEEEKTTRKRGRQYAEEDAEEGDAAADGPSARKLFQRVWTEEDEITLLQGMVDFAEKHGGAHPASAVDAFSVLISAALQGEFSKRQVADKIRRLRKKYVTHLRRGGKKGADLLFANPHERAAFKLSKKIWATVEGGTHGSGVDDMGVETADKGGEMGPHRAGAVYPNLRQAITLLEEEYGNNLLTGSVSEAVEKLKPAKAKALEDRCNKHFIAGAKYCLDRAKLKMDLLKSLVEVLDSE